MQNKVMTCLLARRKRFTYLLNLACAQDEKIKDDMNLNIIESKIFVTVITNHFTTVVLKIRLIEKKAFIFLMIFLLTQRTSRTSLWY